MMDPKLKMFLRRLLDSEDVQVVSLADDAENDERECTVEEDLASLRDDLGKLPSPDAPAGTVIQFGFDFFANFVKEMSKEGRIKELEAQLALVRQEDDDSEPERHEALHLELQRLLGRQLSLEADLLSRFLVHARSSLTPTPDATDA